jgi:hypothetical protein
MYTFKILTAPPGFFTGGVNHNSSDEEDLITMLSDKEFQGGEVFSDEDYTERQLDLLDDNYYGGDDVLDEIPEDIFGGQPLYVDSENIGPNSLDSLIRSDYDPNAAFTGGLTMTPDDFDGIFD